MSATVYNCPACGSALRVEKMAGSSGSWERGQRFDFGPGRLPSGASELSREIPAANLASIEAGARLPAVQATLFGLAAALLTGVGCWYWYWPWVRAPVVGVLVGAGSLISLLRDSRRLLRTSETVLAEPAEAAFGVQVEITDNDHGKRRMRFAQFNAKPGQVRRFGTAALAERLTPEGSGLSRRVFNQIRDEAIARGLICWRNPEAHSQGVEPSRSGLAVFTHLLEEL